MNTIEQIRAEIKENRALFINSKGREKEKLRSKFLSLHKKLFSAMTEKYEKDWGNDPSRKSWKQNKIPTGGIRPINLTKK